MSDLTDVLHWLRPSNWAGVESHKAAQTLVVITELRAENERLREEVESNCMAANFWWREAYRANKQKLPRPSKEKDRECLKRIAELESAEAERDELREWKAKAIERARDEVLAEQASEPLTRERLKEFAKDNPPPDSWFEEEQASEVLEQIAERLRLRRRTHSTASLAVFICSRCRESVDTVYEVGSGANVEHVCVKCVNAGGDDE